MSSLLAKTPRVSQYRSDTKFSCACDQLQVSTCTNVEGTHNAARGVEKPILSLSPTDLHPFTLFIPRGSLTSAWLSSFPVLLIYIRLDKTLRTTLLRVPAARQLTMFDAGPGIYLATSAVVLAGLSWCRTYCNNHSHPPLPPGPLSLPIVGSIFSLGDPVRPWLGFNAWKHIYGWDILPAICS